MSGYRGSECRVPRREGVNLTGPTSRSLERHFGLSGNQAQLKFEPARRVEVPAGATLP